MASTHKTATLFLNKWLGSDKPKKDDFNGDNDRIDEAFAGLSARILSTETKIKPLESHASNSVLHVTAADKAKWNEGGGSKLEIGSYTGSGAASRTVTLGFKPRFGYLFAVGYNAVDGKWDMGECNIYAGFFSSEGSSKLIAVTDTGFTAQHMTTLPLDGACVKLNQSGVKYVYVVGR
jgi:hypothetical protein